MGFKTWVWAGAAWAALSTALPAQAGAPGAENLSSGPLPVRTAVTPPDMISGGDIRLVIDDASRPARSVEVWVDGRRTPVRFERSDGALTGVLRGLPLGPSEVVVRAPGYAETRLALVNHSLGGPIFSGPQTQPWICAAVTARPATDDAAAVEASGLAVDAQSADCLAPPVRSLFYRTTAQDCGEGGDPATACFQPYDPRATRPHDMARITGPDGRERDFIVQVERGSLNRGLYDLAVLFDPSGPADRRLSGWNGKMVWAFGGSGGNQRRQTPPASSWMHNDALALGFMVGVSNLTDGSRNNNRVLAAETLMMAREYVSDAYGPVRHLIGQGCSAGSMQQNNIATMYPGLIDAATIACAYPDSESLQLEITDQFLLSRYFQSEAFRAANPGASEGVLAQVRTAISGHKDDGVMEGWGRFLPGYAPGVTGTAPSSNGCRLPNALVYEPERNPNGVRCATPDLSVNIWGVYPGTNVGRQFRDNVGVQYGFNALLSGAIDAENFLALNAHIGGLDTDARLIDQRMTGDPEAITIAYRAGLVSDGHVLASTPIIDIRGEENSSVHANWHSFALRDRLQNANGNLDSYAIWRVGLPLRGHPWTNNPTWKETGLGLRSLTTLDAWLDAIDADHAPGSRPERVRRNRPASLTSFCYLGADYVHEVTDEATCDRDPNLAYYTGTRQVAGAPRSADVLKCQLKPVDPADYRGRLTPDQLDRLRRIFADGVCDWSKPGVSQQPAQTWMRF